MDQNFIIKYNESGPKKRYRSIESFSNFSKKKKVVEVDRHPTFKMDMLDLNDYLQEILDKYHIVGDVKHGSEFHYSIGTSRNNGVTKPAFIISNIPKNIFIDLYSDLIKAWDNIEKRLSHKIMIDYEDTRSWIHPTPNDGDWMEDSHMIIITPVEGGEIVQKKPILQRIKKWVKNEEISFRVNKKKSEMYLTDPLFDKRKEISEILSNLEDCLYEIFDKYHIPEGNTDETMYPFRWWRLNHALTDPKIMIGRMDMIKGKKIYDDIVRIKPMVEERIGHQITIQDEFLTGSMYNPHTFDTIDEGVISIKLTEYMTPEIKRPWFNLTHNEKKNVDKLYIEKLNDLENLEDYLQEVFDEFHINKVNCVIDSTLTKLPVYYLEVYQNRICIDNLKETSMLRGENPTRFDVLEYTMRRKSMIEKRLGMPIDLKFLGRNSIYISVEDPVIIENLDKSKSNTQMEDLEDYLQEFFDKFHIEKVETIEELQNKNKLCYIASEGAIVIENIPVPMSSASGFTFNQPEKEKQMMETIRKELVEILPTIEKRLGAYLSFDPHPYGGWLSIDIVDLYKHRNGLPYDPFHMKNLY